MLELRAVTKLYSGIPAVADISFSAQSGEVTGYLGPNGSGKSTTIKMITGLLEPSDGEILFEGEPIDRNRIAYRQRFGYVPEDPHLYPHLSGLEYLEMVSDLRNLAPKETAQKINELLRLLALAPSKHSPISSYSKGMRQKVLIAAALLHNPALVILDEPFSGLDVGTALILRDLISALAAKGKAVLFSSHELETVERICSKVVILQKGKVVANDSIKHLREILAQPNLEGIFSELAIEHDTVAISKEIVHVIEA